MGTYEAEAFRRETERQLRNIRDAEKAVGLAAMTAKWNGGRGVTLTFDQYRELLGRLGASSGVAGT